MPSVHNPKNLRIDTVDLIDVTTIEWDEHSNELIGPAADGEAFHTIAEYGTGVVRGRIIFRNPVQAQAAGNLTGTLTVTLTALAGGVDKTLTIDNVRTSGASSGTYHGKASVCHVNFLASSSDGSTSPVSIS